MALGQGDGAVRLTLMKSALALLALAQGTPQLAAADVEGAEVARFAAAAFAMRARTAPLLQPTSFVAAREVRWSTEHGGTPAWGQEGQGDAVLTQFRERWR